MCNRVCQDGQLACEIVSMEQQIKTKRCDIFLKKRAVSLSVVQQDYFFALLLSTPLLMRLHECSACPQCGRMCTLECSGTPLSSSITCTRTISSSAHLEGWCISGAKSRRCPLELAIFCFESAKIKSITVSDSRCFMCWQCLSCLGANVPLRQELC